MRKRGENGAKVRSGYNKRTYLLTLGGVCERTAVTISTSVRDTERSGMNLCTPLLLFGSSYLKKINTISLLIFLIFSFFSFIFVLFFFD